MKIGFFDSGLGGITVFKEALNKGIKAEYIYLADNKNAPYGIKDKKQVEKYVFESVEYLASCGCEIIVIACNTATAICIEKLRKKISNVCIIGTEPAVKVAADDKNNKRILVTATTITINEEKLKNLISNLNITDKVDLLPLDKLVQYAENTTKYEEVEKYLKKELSHYNLEEYSHIVLGCTHFPLYKDIFIKVIPNNVKVIDGGKGIVNNLMSKINVLNLNEEKESITLVLTNNDNKFVEKFKVNLNREIDKVLYI